MAGKTWSNKEDRQLRQMYPHHSTRRISELLGRSERAIYSRAVIMGLKKDEEYLNSPACGRLQKGQSASPGTRFKKGHKTWNKGMKGLQIGGQQTRFKKGNLPHNTREDFAISIRADKSGKKYKYIRVALGKWVLLQRHNWEQVNGPIPEGMKLVFKDRNTMNCDVSNLEMVTCSQLMKRNSVHNYPKPIAQAIQLRGALNRQINKHLKNISNEKQNQ